MRAARLGKVSALLQGSGLGSWVLGIGLTPLGCSQHPRPETQNPRPEAYHLTPIGEAPPSLLQVRQFPENLKAPFDLLPGQGLQALRAEALDRKRSHHSSVEQGALEDLTVQLCLRSNVAHKASGEGISRAGGIFDFLNGKSGGAEGMASDAECAFAEENSRAVFAVL